MSDRNLKDISNELENIGARGEIRILFCIIPDSGPTYAKIKQMAEIDHGVLTQCIKSNTVFKKRSDLSTISNILLKVNAKLNGTNHKLQSTPILSGSKCMVIGADVTHPSPEQTKIPRYTMNIIHKSIYHMVNVYSVLTYLYFQCCRCCCQPRPTRIHVQHLLASPRTTQGND